MRSGEKMERAIQTEVPSQSCRADECLREYHQAITRTRRKPRSAVHVAIPTGATGRASRRDSVDTEFPRRTRADDHGVRSERAISGPGLCEGISHSLLYLSLEICLSGLPASPSLARNELAALQSRNSVRSSQAKNSGIGW